MFTAIANCSEQAITILRYVADRRAAIDQCECVVGRAEQRTVRLSDAAIDDCVQEHSETCRAACYWEVDLGVVVLRRVGWIEDREA